MSDLGDLRLRQRVTRAGRARRLLPGVIIIAAMLVAWLIFGGG